MLELTISTFDLCSLANAHSVFSSLCPTADQIIPRLLISIRPTDSGKSLRAGGKLSHSRSAFLITIASTFLIGSLLTDSAELYYGEMILVTIIKNVTAKSGEFPPTILKSAIEQDSTDDQKPAST